MRLSDIIAGSVLRVQETLTLLILLTITLTATRILTVFCSFSLLLFVEVVSEEDKEKATQSEQETPLKEGSNSQVSKLLKLLRVAWIIFLSELGDKSQITTIILSTEYNPWAIFIGTALAHVLGIILSMTVGYFIAKHTNKRILAAIGAFCFLYFGAQMSMDFFKSGGIKALLSFINFR